jgi:hypothetical protein
LIARDQELSAQLLLAKSLQNIILGDDMIAASIILCQHSAIAFVNEGA